MRLEVVDEVDPGPEPTHLTACPAAAFRLAGDDRFCTAAAIVAATSRDGPTPSTLPWC